MAVDFTKYTQLEYIESTGTQYIDTRYKSSNNIKIEATIKWTTQTDNWAVFFGTTDVENSSNGILARIYYLVSTNFNPWFLNANYDERQITTTINTWHDIKLQKNVISLDSTNYSISTTGTAYQGNIFLFAGNNSGNVWRNSKMSLKSLKIYDNDILVRDFYPAKRDSDGVLGLYDIVNDIFYTNAGTGTFVAGAEIYNILPQVSPSGYGTVTGGGTFSYGDSCILTATPNSNAQFVGWYINSNPIGDSTSLTYYVTANTTFEARFERVWNVTTNVVGNGAIQYTRGTDKNDITLSVIPNANHHFVKYEISGLSREAFELITQSEDYIITYNGDNIVALKEISGDITDTPFTIYIKSDTTITAYFEEDDKFHVTASTSFENGSIYISDNDVYAGTVVTLWARPFPDYVFVKWEDGSYENPRSIVVTQNVTMIAEYQRLSDTNGIYQYRCFVKDQLDLEASPKAFLVADTFTVKPDLMTNSTSTINVQEMPSNVNIGDVLVLYGPKGQFLYNGVIKSIDDLRITCSQMQSFYKGLWIYNTHPSTSLEEEIAYLLGQYAQGKIYGSTYTDSLVAQRLGGITIDFVANTSANLPTDLDKDGNEQYTTKDMEQFIYELYENYGIVFDFEINLVGTNYVHIKVPNYETIKVGNNMFAIQNMLPMTTIEETNRLIIFSSQKVYRTTYVATKNGIVEQPASTVNRFDITNTKVVFSDDDVSDLISANLPSSMFNHKIEYDLIIKNFIYEFGDFNLGGKLDIYYGDDYYNSVLTGYEITKASNQNITRAHFVCGKVRTKLTKRLTLGNI